MKNFERFRQLSAEEMAKKMMPSECEKICIFGDCCDADKDDCYEGIKVWLESEVEDAR